MTNSRNKSTSNADKNANMICNTDFSGSSSGRYGVVMAKNSSARAAGTILPQTGFRVSLDLTFLWII